MYNWFNPYAIILIPVLVFVSETETGQSYFILDSEKTENIYTIITIFTTIINDFIVWHFIAFVD